MRKLATAIGVTLLGTAASPVHAQLGLVEGLFRNVTDISFYVGRGSFLPASNQLATGKYGLYNFGVELLFEVAPPEPPEEGEEPPPPPTFTYELGVGYGQIAGFHSSEEGLDLRASLRELPAISFYASHEATGFYLGMRTGLLQTDALRLYNEEGRIYGGKAQSFQLGGIFGYALGIGGTYVFVESGWVLRHFPSIEWSGSEIPEAAPRSLRMSGWQLLIGLQVPIR